MPEVYSVPGIVCLSTSARDMSLSVSSWFRSSLSTTEKARSVGANTVYTLFPATNELLVGPAMLHAVKHVGIIPKERRCPEVFGIQSSGLCHHLQCYIDISFLEELSDPSDGSSRLLLITDNHQ